MEIFNCRKVMDFFRWGGYGIFLSSFLVVLCCCLFAVVGFTLGIDFSGGSLVQVRYEGHAPISRIRAAMEQSHVFDNAHVSEFGSLDEVLIKIPFSRSLPSGDLLDQVKRVLANTGSFEIRKLDTVGPRVGAELARSAVISLVLVAVAIMIYVSFRYDWHFSISGIVTLIHDIVITATSVIVFGIDLNLDVVAALLTLLGYSINDTIILFDRIRERMASTTRGSTPGIASIINESITDTLSRTVLTSLTMFFAVLTLYLFGGKAVTGFSLPLLVGIICGTYSSLFIAPRLIVLSGFSVDSYRNKEAKRQKMLEERERLRKMYEGGRV